MNTRTFIKNLFLGGMIAVPQTKKSLTDSRPKITLIEEPFNKRIEFDFEGLHYTIRVTDQILLQNEDGSVELNVYGDWCRVIARVTTPNTKQLKCRGLIVEGDNLLKSALKQTTFDFQVDKIIEVVKRNFEEKASKDYSRPLPHINLWC